MYNRQSKYNIGITLTIIALVGALLFGLWGLFFKDRVNQSEPEDNEVVEPIDEQPVLDIKDYKVYKNDNVDYRFILVEVESNDEINLRDLQTSENFSLDQSSNLVSSLITKGYQLNDVLNELTEDSKGILFIPVYDESLDEIELMSESVDINNPTFNLSNPIEDKSQLGFVEKEEPEDNQEEEEEEPVVIDQPDPIIDDTPVLPSALQEVDPATVYIHIDGEVVEVGYPSNIRVFTVEVSRPEGSSPIVGAAITFLHDDLTFEASDQSLLMVSTNQANILHRTDITSGLLFFEVNTAQYNITDLQYDLEIVGGN